MLTVTDIVGTSGSVTVDKDGVADAIRAWYPDPPLVVTQAIDLLQDALNRGDDNLRHVMTNYLGVEITHGQ